MPELINSSLPIFIIIALGYILSRFKIADTDWSEAFSEYAVKIGFPVLIFYNLSSAKYTDNLLLSTTTLNSIYLLAIFFIAILLSRLLFKDTQLKNSFVISSLFSNTAFIGIPYIKAILPEQGVILGSIIAACYLFWVFTIGIYYLSRKQHKSKNLFFTLLHNPLLIAVILGIAFQFLDLKLPLVVNNTLHLLASSVTAVILIAIGMFVGNNKKSTKNNLLRPSILLAVLTLMCYPFIAVAFVKLSDIDNIFVAKATIIDAAMPVAITPFALASQYNLNKGFIAQSIVYSTVLSLITLPLWLLIVDHLM